MVFTDACFFYSNGTKNLLIGQFLLCITLLCPHHICLDIAYWIKSLFFLKDGNHISLFFCYYNKGEWWNFCHAISNMKTGNLLNIPGVSFIYFFNKMILYIISFQELWRIILFFNNLPLLLHILLSEATQIIAWDSGWHTEWILWMCLQTTGTKDSWLSTSWCRPMERNAEDKQPVWVHRITCGIFRVQRVYCCKGQWQRL